MLLRRTGLRRAEWWEESLLTGENSDTDSYRYAVLTFSRCACVVRDNVTVFRYQQ